VLISVKGIIKLYSIILLSVLIVREFVKTGGSFKNQLITGFKSASIIPVVLYILNI
jgi:hypothetical protein